MRTLVTLAVVVVSACALVTTAVIVVIRRAAKAQPTVVQVDYRRAADYLAADPAFVAAMAREQAVTELRAAIDAWEG